MLPSTPRAYAVLARLSKGAGMPGYFRAQLGDIVEGDVVVVFGAGPVGLFAAKSAWLMGQAASSSSIC